MKDRDDIPIMLLGLKRDLRVEKEGVIYPQEVSCPEYTASAWAGMAEPDIWVPHRGSKWLKISAVIATRSVRLRQASS